MGLFIILIVGFIDDLIDIKASWKLIGEVVAAFFLIVVADLRLPSFHGFMGIYELPLLISYAVSFFVLTIVTEIVSFLRCHSGGKSISSCQVKS